MNLITVERVSKSFPERPVLDGVTLGIEEGDRIGVIGANGSGKTTLLELIAGRIEPDEGRVIRAGGTRVAMLEQDPSFDPAATLAEAAGDDRAMIALLDRLGLTDLSQTVGTLSGGQRRRLALAEVLSTEAEVTILDEPTNHLDVDVIDWMEERLDARPGALVIVTHDRYLLDRVATKVVEVHRTEVMSHRGTYEDFLASRAEREAQAEATERKRRNLARIELDWLRRSPKARTGKSKARIDAAHRLLAAEQRVVRANLELEMPSRRLGTKVVALEGVAVGFGGEPVLADVTWRIARDARIGVVGPNGSGKTTLLRLLAGRLAADRGTVEIGDTVAPGWFGQHPEPVDENRRLLDTIRDIAEHTRLDAGITVSAGQLLERFGFPSGQHSTLVGELSGGERRRLELLRMLAHAPNLLLLDEPTNDLDIDTLGVLEAMLDDWPGAMVAASHDRYFLERVCDDIVSIEPDGSLRHHPGGWAAYRERRRAEGAQPSRAEPRPPVPTPERRADTRLTYNERRELAILERDIPRIEEQIARLTSELEETGSDWEAAAGTSARLQEARTKLADAEDRWLLLSERA